VEEPVPILPAQVIAAIESGRNPKLVDVRTKTDFETSPLRLPGAVRLDPDAVLAGQPDAEPSVERDQLIVTYDTSPGETTAEKVANALRARGSRACASSRAASAAGRTRGCPSSRSRTCRRSGSRSTNLTLGDLEPAQVQGGRGHLQRMEKCNSHN